MTERERQLLLLEINILECELRELEERARPIKERLEQLEIDYLLGTIERQCFFDGLFAAALSCEQPEFSIIPHVSNFVKWKFIVQFAQKFPILELIFLLAIH